MRLSGGSSEIPSAQFETVATLKLRSLLRVDEPDITEAGTVARCIGRGTQPIAPYPFLHSDAACKAALQGSGLGVFLEKGPDRGAEQPDGGATSPVQVAPEVVVVW